MARVFVLTGKREGETVELLRRYKFVDGAMIVPSDTDAAMMKPMMDFYACKMMDLEAYEDLLHRKNSAKAEEAVED